MLTNEHLLQAFEAAGASIGVVYLSAPLTSGLREIALMNELHVTSEELHQHHEGRWRAGVFERNTREAAAHADRIRSGSPACIVVDPSTMAVHGWSQADYNNFWIRLMERHAKTLVAAPGWEYSKGARGEVGFAILLGCPIQTIDGTALTRDDVASLDGDAQAALARQGWSPAQVEAYLPAMNYVDRPAVATSPQSQTFDWLVGERDYQLGKFGTATDDAHTRDGLGEDSWWWQQLTNYYYRSRVLGLEMALGRQALAKFVATGCGLLESAIRVYGALPASGVPSGDPPPGDQLVPSTEGS